MNESKISLFKRKGMKILTQSQTNNIPFTLSDVTTLTSTTVYYLFELISLTTLEKTYFTAPNISPNIERYDYFPITLTGSSFINLTAGTINLNPSGEYTYNCYQQYSKTNLDLSGATGAAIETGILLVSGTTPANFITQIYTGQSQTYSYYQ